MPKNSHILMIRHAEKPKSGRGLSAAGKQRALAYVNFFKQYSIESSPLTIDYLFASDDSTNSDRPRKTLRPLATALRMCINEAYTDQEYEALTNTLQQSQFDNSNILICWHHGRILDFASCLLGADANQLPKESHWPASPWPPCVFGWALQLSFDDKGRIIPSQTFCKNENLMPDDQGKDPPAFKCKKNSARQR